VRAPLLDLTQEERQALRGTLEAGAIL
jgi:hypothetical protein